jgi:hypothetical protein
MLVDATSGWKHVTFMSIIINRRINPINMRLTGFQLNRKVIKIQAQTKFRADVRQMS